MVATTARYSAVVLAGAALWSLPALIRAEEQTARYGIIGLFEPERQEDLRTVLRVLPELQLAHLDLDRAEVTLRYDVARLFPNFNPKKPPTPEEIIQRLNNLLAVESQGTFRLKPLSALPGDRLTRLEIRIAILDCRACRYGAYATVMRIEGVERATVAASPCQLTAWIDAGKTDRAALEAALKRVGVQLDP